MIGILTLTLVLGSDPNSAMISPNIARVQMVEDIDRSFRMKQFIKESKKLQQMNDVKHGFWMNNKPSVLTYDRLDKACQSKENKSLPK